MARHSRKKNAGANGAESTNKDLIRDVDPETGRSTELIASRTFFEALFRVIGVEGAKKFLRAIERSSELENESRDKMRGIG